MKVPKWFTRWMKVRQLVEVYSRVDGKDVLDIAWEAYQYGRRNAMKHVERDVKELLELCEINGMNTAGLKEQLIGKIKRYK